MFRLALSAFRLASAFCASACLHRTVSLRSGRGGGGGPEGAKCSRQWSLRGTYSGESSLDAPGKVEPAAWAGGAGRATLATAAARSPTACRRPPRVCAALAWTCIQPWSWWRGLLPVLLPLPPALLLLRVCGSARTRSDRELDCERGGGGARWGCKVGDRLLKTVGVFLHVPFLEANKACAHSSAACAPSWSCSGFSESALGGEPGERDSAWRRRAQPEHGVQQPQGPGEADHPNHPDPRSR